MPDWLRNLRAAAAASENEIPPAEQEEESAPLPEGEATDWLARLRTAPPEPEEAPPTRQARASKGMPDWIKQLQAQLPEDTVADANIPAESLREPDAVVPRAPRQQTPPSKVELPGWIEQLPTDEETAKPNPLAMEEQAAAPPMTGATHSERGQGVDKPTAPQTAGAEAFQTTGAAQSEPRQGLEKPAAPQTTEAEAPQTVGASSPTGSTNEEEVPISSADEFAAELGAVSASAATEPLTTADEDIPEWLRTPMVDTRAATVAQAPAEESPTEISEEPAAVEEATREQPGAEPALEPTPADQLPGWFAALKPEGAELTGEAAEEQPWAGIAAPIEAEPAETKGPLAGLRGVLPLAVSVAEPHLSTKGTKPVEKASVAHIFDRILAEPAAEPAPSAVAVKRRRRGMRRWIYLLIALAVIIPFLVPGGVAGSLVSISNTAAADFYDTLQTAPSGSTVLMSFDYDPSMTGEMDLAANAIARDLVKRQVRIIAVSTLETGPQIAQNVLDKAASGNSYRYGTDYLNLGYLPGHEAGLAQLATTGLPVNSRDLAQGRPLDQFTAFAGIRRLQDVQLVVELAGTEDALKMWMEQVQPRVGVRIVAAVSAGVEPKARVYLGAHQLAAITSGMVGAARFEILSNRPGLAVASINAQSAAMVVLILIVVLGNIVFWVSRARRRLPE